MLDLYLRVRTHARAFFSDNLVMLLLYLSMNLHLSGEHLGYLEACFLKPWTRNCMDTVRKRALHNWNIYCAPARRDTNIDMPGHLMLYPYDVSRDGEVTARCETIPDFPGVPVLGRNHLLLPDIGTG